MDPPHVAKHIFGDQMGPNVQKAIPFCNPPHQGLKIAGVLQNVFEKKIGLAGGRGVAFQGLRAVGHVL